MARTTFALWTIVTFFRPNFRANSKAARTIRSEPFLVLILHETAYWSPGSSAKCANGLLRALSVVASASGTGENSTPA